MAFQSDRLRKAREMRGITQRKLGELCSLPGNQISRYEQGVNDPSTEILAQMAHHLGVTSDYLIGLSDDPFGFKKADLRDDERELLAAYTVGDTAKIMRLSTTRLDEIERQSEA